MQSFRHRLIMTLHFRDQYSRVFSDEQHYYLLTFAVKQAMLQLIRVFSYIRDDIIDYHDLSIKDREATSSIHLTRFPLHNTLFRTTTTAKALVYCPA